MLMKAPSTQRFWACIGCISQQPGLHNWVHAVNGTGERIAVLVDGPHRYSTNTYAPGGRTIAQHRLLAAPGWAVIHVPGYVWAKLSNAVRGAWLLQARCRF